MLTRRLCSVLQKQCTKFLSAVSTPKPDVDLPEEQVSRADEILQHPDYFKVHNLFTVKDLFDARVHYGHKEALLHDNMKPFIFGSRLGHVIFDLDITAYHLREALNFAAHIAYRDGIILFVSKNPSVTLLVEKTAISVKEYALTREWIMGLFTDSQNKYRTHIRLPDLLIMFNTLEENGFQHQAVVEAAKMAIPVIGIVDSNCNPNLITYPVPGNDDSYPSIKLYCNLFKTAILRGKCEREKESETYKKVDEKSTEKNFTSQKAGENARQINLEHKNAAETP